MTDGRMTGNRRKMLDVARGVVLQYVCHGHLRSKISTKTASRGIPVFARVFMATLGAVLFLVVLSMSQGFVAFSRRLAPLKLERHPNALRLLWKLYMEANYHEYPKPIMVAGLPVQLRPGQVLFDRERYAEELRISVKAVRCALRFLIGANVAAKTRANRRANACTVITLLDWLFSNNVSNEGANTRADIRANVGAIFKEEEIKKVKNKYVNDPPQGEDHAYFNLPIIRPTVDQIIEYASQEHDYDFSYDADVFIAKYDRIDWRFQNGHPIDWRRMVSRWVHQMETNFEDHNAGI